MEPASRVSSSPRRLMYRDGTYIAAGSTTFCVSQIESDAIAPQAPKVGSTVPFQRRFREALEPLPAKLRHPAPPSEPSESSRRSWFSFLIPIVSTGGFFLAMSIGGDRGPNKLYLLFMLLPQYFSSLIVGSSAGDRRRSRAKKKAEYEESCGRFRAELENARMEERRRDRWAATPPGLAGLLTRVHHSRLWERSATDEDFCEVAIGTL